MSFRQKISLFLILFIFISSPIYSQNKVVDSLKADGFNVYNSLEENVDGLGKLYKWFTQNDRSLHTNDVVNKRVIPYGIYSIGNKGNANLSKYPWTIGFDYSYPLNALNLRMGLPLLGLNDNNYISTNITFGAGLKNIDFLPEKAEVSLGISLQYNYMSTNSWWKNPTAAIFYNYISPSLTSDFDGMFMAVGNKFFFTDDRVFSFDVNLGRSFWSSSNKSPNSFFGTAGLSINQFPDVTVISGNNWSSLEVGASVVPTLGTVGLTALLPYNILNSVSVAPFVQFGIGYGNITWSQPFYKQTTADYILSVGADLRIFGKNKKNFLINPYIGTKYMWLQYPEDTFKDLAGNDFDRTVNGNGLSIYIGNRVPIFKNFIDLDVNIGPTFWGKTHSPWTKPSDWNANIGLVVNFGGICDEAPSLSGQILVKNIGEKENIGKFPLFDGLAGKDLLEYKSEVRAYLIQDNCKPELYTEQAFGDLSDIKFFWVDINFIKFVKDMRSESYLMTQEEYLDKVKNYYATRKKVYIAAAFDPRRVNIDKLKEKELLIHFVDYENDQYFGYKSNTDGLREPNKLDVPISKEIVSNSSYHGNFKKYVKEMNWLDNSNTIIAGLKSSTIQDLLKDEFLSNIANYYNKDSVSAANNDNIPFPSVAIAEYSINDIRRLSKLKNGKTFGAAIKVGVDHDGNGIFVDDAGYNFDYLNDDFVFTNHFKIDNVEDIVNNVVAKYELNNFRLGDAEIRSNHKSIIDNKIIPSVRGREDLTIYITGYTDATPLSADIQYKTQEELSLARAQKLKEYIESSLGNRKIIIEGLGVYPNSGENQRENRKVVVRIGFDLGDDE